MNTTVYIDPNHRITYSSYYIKGLITVFGEKNIKFSSKYFYQLEGKIESHSFDHYFAFVLINNKKTLKCIIDYRDKRSIKPLAYKWCDIYGKINYRKETTPAEYQSKIISIPPSFGIHLYDKAKSALLGISNLLKSYSRLSVPPKLFLTNYIGQYQRPKIEQYEVIQREEQCNYCFFISTLWEHENCITGTNKWRAQYIRECRKQANLAFEGGLFASPENIEYQAYQDVIINKHYDRTEYLEKTKKSLFVFNTPAVHECHGWKLGEFLAMGKAIISTPISNDLPVDLKHGENIHIVNSEKELKEAIDLLLNDREYRLKLERGSTAYYKQYASPSAVINHVHKHLLKSLVCD
jgi:glycosyltransferase involved in cell wall biosynthesis